MDDEQGIHCSRLFLCLAFVRPSSSDAFRCHWAVPDVQYRRQGRKQNGRRSVSENRKKKQTNTKENIRKTVEIVKIIIGLNRLNHKHKRIKRRKESVSQKRHLMPAEIKQGTDSQKHVRDEVAPKPHEVYKIRMQ